MADELREERFTLRFTGSDRALLDALSRELDVSAGTVVRWALREYADRWRKRNPKRADRLPPSTVDR